MDLLLHVAMVVYPEHPARKVSFFTACFILRFGLFLVQPSCYMYVMYIANYKQNIFIFLVIMALNIFIFLVQCNLSRGASHGAVLTNTFHARRRCSAWGSMLSVGGERVGIRAAYLQQGGGAWTGTAGTGRAAPAGQGAWPGPDARGVEVAGDARGVLEERRRRRRAGREAVAAACRKRGGGGVGAGREAARRRCRERWRRAA